MRGDLKAFCEPESRANPDVMWLEISKHGVEHGHPVTDARYCQKGSHLQRTRNDWTIAPNLPAMVKTVEPQLFQLSQSPTRPAAKTRSGGGGKLQGHIGMRPRNSER